MPEVFSLTSDEKRRERGSAGHTFTASPLNSIAPKEKKETSGTQGSRKSDIFKLKFDKRSFVRLERIALCIGGTPQKCTKFCQQLVYSQNDTLLVGIPISRRETNVLGVWREILT